MKAYTDYPFIFLGDVEFEEAPIRKIEVLSYDGRKYCKILVEGLHSEIKFRYIYSKKGRYGEVPSLSDKQLTKLRPICNQIRSN